MQSTETWYDAHVGVFANGNVSIVPEQYECEKEPMTPKGGTMLSQGRMLMSPDGTAQYVAYNHHNSPRYRLLCSTEHGRVKVYDKSLIVEFKFPAKGMTQKMIAKALRDETFVMNQNLRRYEEGNN